MTSRRAALKAWRGDHHTRHTYHYEAAQPPKQSRETQNVGAAREPPCPNPARRSERPTRHCEAAATPPPKQSHRFEEEIAAPTLHVGQKDLPVIARRRPRRRRRSNPRRRGRLLRQPGAQAHDASQKNCPTPRRSPPFTSIIAARRRFCTFAIAHARTARRHAMGEGQPSGRARLPADASAPRQGRLSPSHTLPGPGARRGCDRGPSRQGRRRQWGIAIPARRHSCRSCQS